MLGWDHDLHDRTRIGPHQAQLAAKFLDSLPHSAYPHADAVGPEFHYALFHALAIVANRDHQFTVPILKSDPSIPGSTVAENLFLYLLNESEGHRFLITLKSGELNR